MRISDWSSDVCSSDLAGGEPAGEAEEPAVLVRGRRARLARDRTADLRGAAGAGRDRGLEQVGHPGSDIRRDEDVTAIDLMLVDRHAVRGQDRKSTRLNSSH